MDDVMTAGEAQALARLDQMAIEIEQLRQAILDQVRARQPKRVKPIEEYEFYGMWKDRPEWDGLNTEETFTRGAHPAG